jgi:hypothetical protein
MPMYTPPQLPIDNDDGISNDAIGGPTGHLLEHNAQVIGQIRANLAACKVYLLVIPFNLASCYRGGCIICKGQCPLVCMWNGKRLADSHAVGLLCL